MIETATLEGTFGGQAGGDSAVRYLVLAMQSTHPHESPARFELDGRIKTVIIGRGTSRTTVRSADMSELRVDVPDRRMSGRHAILRWSRGRFALEDAGSKNGIRVNNVRTEGATLADGDVIELGSTYFVYRDVRVSEEELKARSGSPSQPGHVLSTMCLPLELRFRVMKRVAAADVPVMVRGETGTGKELVARAIHQASARTGAFVPANCGAIAANLVESELFGHKKGAFSGATQDKPGLVLASDGGTLFLDEIAELPEPAQVALLRVLQEREVRAVGAATPTKVDLRVVSASHRDLATLVEDGAFRQDLFSRLAGYTMLVPPLRERREDLGLLVSSLLRRLNAARAESVSLHTSAARALFAHRWPMNVRELEQALRVALAVAEGDELAAGHLPDSVHAAPATAQEDPSTDADRRAQLVALLERHKGNLSAVARDMSTSRSQVRRLAQRFGVDPESFR